MVPNSSLFDETTFYGQFTRDLLHCTSEVVIECPFITRERMRMLSPVFRDLVARDVRVYVITRDPLKHEPGYEEQSEEGIHNFEVMGVRVFLVLAIATENWLFLTERFSGRVV